MFLVDNSGKGNCMYYAYSISLMYYLRANNAPERTEHVFNKLKLKEDDKIQLRKLLSKNPNYQFTSREIKTIIEPLLGRATRDLAAEHTKLEFKLSPHDTPLFSSAKYGLEFCFKQSLLANGSELSTLIDHEFINPDFTEAEIYKIRSTDVAMTEYSLLRMPHVIEEFNRLWLIKESELKNEEKQFTEHEIKVQKENLLDNIIRDETVNFFLAEDEKYLNLYKDHLQKEFVWGSEETLLVLHRAIQGERMVRNSNGRLETFYDTEIVLHLHRDGIAPFYQSNIPEMILNNQNNLHWTSLIPESVFTPKLTDKEQMLFELLDEMHAMHPRITVLFGEDRGERDWLSILMKQMDIIYTNPSYAIKEKALESVFQLIGKVMPRLGLEPSWRPLLSNFLSALVDCSPIFLADKPKDLILECQTAEQSQERNELSVPKQVQTRERSKCSRHTLFQSEGPRQKTYPQEISRYVSEGKQSGPRVANALRQMYQEGTYSPEECREIALQYLSYVKYKKRHFVLTDVNHFIEEMNEIIKVDYEQEIRYLDARDRNTARDVLTI
ncbi:hypothetical protein DGG96_18390 [Legionella qingyii]|uniref:Dot/Icm T4SS effector n=1 Tax=Legionella qingyii TaxID=2184757 RepID=A0A317U1C8_9GAMM|nr:hypothetical protein [Legionella qingyii]PWY54180.1 hypothetical protein DGG96_18390 [Legionella qingyii]RUR23601.1 hypothetical protein ELY16_13140 [Legionella qingyii]RUR24079.1 hypothetical protein ELY20_05820 [Legionella qingyii]